MSLLARFLAVNRRLSQAADELSPEAFKRHLHTVYKYEVATLINRRPGQVVLDIGGGKDCPFLPFVMEPDSHRIVAVDYSEDELRRNRGLKLRVVADAAARGLPFRDGIADLIVSRSVVEHLHDNEIFFENCARALRPGGVVVHTFPCKFAPFALINRMIPDRLTRWLIGYFHPQWQADCGFPAFYDRCSFSEMQNLLKNNGFENHRFIFRYYQSIYFNFFFPLYLLILLYDLTISFLRIRNLACAILLTAERPSAQPGQADGIQSEASAGHATAQTSSA